MNKKQFIEEAMSFFESEMETEIVSEVEYFHDYITYCPIELKPDDEATEINTPFASGRALSDAERHRRHRAGIRKEKAKRHMVKNSHWAYYQHGVATECKTKNHRAVRREYDIPMGKGNFVHKVASFEYWW